MRTFAQKQNQPQKQASPSLARPNMASLGPPRREHPVLHLQRTIANQAGHRMLHTPAEEFKVGLTGTPAPGFGHDCGRIPIHPPTAGAIQTKLAINQPGDQYEREAERISEHVMRMPEPQIQRVFSYAAAFSRHQTEGPERLPTKHVGAGDFGQSAAPPHVHEVIRSPGQALEPATRDFMEPRFGYDFSRVRVHCGTAAEQSARDVNARAYTLGHHIVFAAGQYLPRTGRGTPLLAHELAHVVQQQAVAHFPVGIQRYEGPEHQDLGDKHADQLFDFIQTEEGKKWAAERKIDVVKLVRQIADDPVHRDKKIKVRADLQLTPGQIISLMGDFYATWQDLKGAPKSEIDQILAVMDKERLGTAKNANAEYETITKGRYTQLARKNTPHFAPKNKEAWKELHVQAIQKAKLSKQENPTGNDDLYQEALGMDAAGGHFLTDAFSSGHLMDSTKVQAAIQSHLLANPIRTENPEMQTVVAGVQAAGLAVPLALKNIHDRMNAEGFDVTNAQGMKWRTYGDNHLKNAVETQRVAAYAVFVSRQQINQARNGESPDPNEVLALLPDATTVDRATDQAIAYIPQAVREISPLINRSIGMLDTVKPPWYLGGPVLPFVGKSVLGTISDPGRLRVLDDYDRRKQDDPTTPYPTAPLLRWNF